MCVAVIGGMKRLDRHYRNEAKRQGIKLSVFNRLERGMTTRISRADAIVVFTNKVSHNARNEAVDIAKKNGIPLFMYHSCGLCTLRECLHCLQDKFDNGTA